jgi:hypothetical protein
MALAGAGGTSVAYRDDGGHRVHFGHLRDTNAGHLIDIKVVGRGGWFPG